MISSVSNFDKTKAIILSIMLFIPTVLVVNEIVYHFIGDYIVYPADISNLQSFDNFVSFAKFSLKFFGIFFILGIVLFLGFTFFEKHVLNMGGYTTLSLFFYLLNVFERLNKG